MFQPEKFKDLSCVFLKLPPENIAFLKFILESYEGLGIIRTLSVKRGEVVILSPTDSFTPLQELLEDLEPELKHHQIPPPQESISADWLLASDD